MVDFPSILLAYFFLFTLLDSHFPLVFQTSKRTDILIRITNHKIRLVSKKRSKVSESESDERESEREKGKKLHQKKLVYQKESRRSGA
jgi:hypothetical protein